MIHIHSEMVGVSCVVYLAVINFNTLRVTLSGTPRFAACEGSVSPEAALWL